MKQQKVDLVPPPAPKPAPPRGPRYRYFSTTPTTVTLRMRDLQVPEKARTASYNSEQFVDLPCVDIFRGPVPKIRLSRLAELAPDCVTARDLPDESVKVCSARLALAYAVIEDREVIEEPPAPIPAPEPPLAPKPSMEEFAPPVPSIPAAKVSTHVPAVKVPEVSAKEEPPKEEKKPSSEPPKLPEPVIAKKTSAPILPPPRPSVPERSATIPPPAIPIPANPAPAIIPAPNPAAGAEAAPSKPAAPESAAEPVPAPPAAVATKKPFSLFPMFRRKEASDDKQSTPVPRGRIEIPKPKRPPSPVLGSSSEATAEPPPEPATEPASNEVKPTAAPPSIPKARFEPVRSFEPKIIPAPSAAPAAPPREPEEKPAPPKEPAAPATLPPLAVQSPLPAVAPAPELPPVSKSVPPAAVELPELPAFAPKDPPPTPAAELPKEAPAPIPAPEVKPEPVQKPILKKPVVPELRTVPIQAPFAARVPSPSASKEPVSKEPAPPASEGSAPAVEPVELAVTEAPKTPPPMLEVPRPAQASAAPALLVETEHLSKNDAPPEIAEQDALQAIFLTEEFLSVDRVLELCGNLPGIHSCVLSQGASVIASHNAPDSVDVVSLSAHALEMLKAMRASSAKMGIGAVPAVTVHSEKGPITFFHQDDICLLVLHKDRGFIPGVREKLQHVVDELSKAKLPLRLGGGEGKKLLGK